jgi:cytoplasmic iron level regulating protein YaaA (DUF328/UPF0246 family)
MPKVSAVSQGVRGIMMILSPAKTLDFKPMERATAVPSSWPDCNPERTSEIARAMKRKTGSELAKMLGLSSALAATTKQYWNTFEVSSPDGHAGEGPAPSKPEATKPCVFAYAGPAFQGLQALDCSDSALEYLQNNLRIVDALYGLLRPMDRIQPYRLEMASSGVFGNDRAKLNSYWSGDVTDRLNKELEKRPDPLMLNLASEEYAATIDKSKLGERVVLLKAAFQEEGRVVSVHAKRARGLMARYLAEHNISTIEGIKEFAEEGYSYDESRSNDSTLVFNRKKQAAKRKAVASAKIKAEPPPKSRKR